MTYEAHYWVDPSTKHLCARIDGLPGVVTWGNTYEQATTRIREALALWLDVPEGVLDVRDTFKGTPAQTVALERMHEAKRQSVEAAHRATTATKEAIKALAQAGLSRRDIGGILGVTHQRISQLLAPGLPS